MRAHRPAVRSTSPSVPAPLSLEQALRASDPLRELARRVAQSRACLACVSAALPAGLRQAVSAGPVDDEGFTLLVRNAAAAAKLRQLKPHLDVLLAEGFGAALTLRIKVQASR